MLGIMIKTCKECGKEYKTYKSINKKHCSRACSIASAKKVHFDKYSLTCKFCGTIFLPPRPKDGGSFCSYECSGKARTMDRVDRMGYWFVMSKNHPNASKQGYVAEHHLVMERSLGHFIEKGMVVHHIDMNKKNNSLDNLMYLSDSEHKSLHANLRGGSNGRFK